MPFFVCQCVRATSSCARAGLFILLSLSISLPLTFLAFPFFFNILFSAAKSISSQVARALRPRKQRETRFSIKKKKKLRDASLVYEFPMEFSSCLQKEKKNGK